MPPVRSGLRAALTLPRVGGLEFVQRLLSPARHTLDAPVAGHGFGGRGARMLVAGNAAHADLASTSSGSSVIGLLLAMLGQTVGYPVPEGGAGRLTEAMAARFRSRVVLVSVGVGVDRVLVENGSGDRRGDRRHIRPGPPGCGRRDRGAPAGAGPAQPGRRPRPLSGHRVRRFRRDPGTFKVDFALTAPVPGVRCGVRPGDGAPERLPDDPARHDRQLAADRIPERPSC